MSPSIRSRLVALALVVITTLCAGQAGPPVQGGAFGGTDRAEMTEEKNPIVPVFLPMPAPAARTWLRLQEPVSASFANEMPFEDFLKFLKDSSRGKDRREVAIPIYVDPIALNEVERTLQSPIVIDLEGVPMATVLRLACKQLSLDFTVQKDGIVIIAQLAATDPEPETVADPNALMLAHLTALREEVASLRRELQLLRPHPGPMMYSGPMGGPSRSEGR